VGDQRKIWCDSHGEFRWNGEAQCDCGRAHLLILTLGEDGEEAKFVWDCDCGRVDPIECLSPICNSCYREISGKPYYGPD
jgi:hypothetical protein